MHLASSIFFPTVLEERSSLETEVPAPEDRGQGGLG